MADPAQIDIVTDRRVALTQHFAFLGQDYTGSTLKMQVRAIRDATGTPLIDDPGGNVSLLYGGTATIAAHITAGRLTAEIYNQVNPATGTKYQATDSTPLSQIGLGIIQATIAALPFPEQRGDDLVSYYDVLRTPSAGDAEIIMRGQFIVRAGVTIP